GLGRRPLVDRPHAREDAARGVLRSGRGPGPRPAPARRGVDLRLSPPRQRRHRDAAGSAGPPGGSRVTAADAMTPGPLTITPRTSVAAAPRPARDHGISPPPAA